MKSRLLGLAVVIVAMAFIVNALALSSASVNGSAMTIPIVNASAALLALGAPASPDPDIDLTGSGTTFDLKVEHGVQADSSYTFDQAFAITNNSDDNIALTVTVTGVPAGMTLSLLNDADGSSLTPGIGTVSMSANTSINVRMVVATASGAAANAGNNIRIGLSATAVRP